MTQKGPQLAHYKSKAVLLTNRSAFGLAVGGHQITIEKNLRGYSGQAPNIHASYRNGRQKCLLFGSSLGKAYAKCKRSLSLEAQAPDPGG